MTEKQQLAKKRNWLKFRLKGLKIPIDKSILTPMEILRFQNLHDTVEALINDFDASSKVLGLNSTTEFEREEKRQNKYLKELIDSL
jgi:hypothetical protein